MPISHQLKTLLQNRWNSLPAELRVSNQVVGRHWVHCAFTMGSPYCSFGCSHCYLPGSSNRVPMPSLDEMKTQIQANRDLSGPGSNIQITGGDLVDAYLKTGRFEELIEIISYSVDQGLVPMLMTHGQGLMQNPHLLDELIERGGLRKICFHIDITQAGRSGFPARSLENESQLNPVRDQFVSLLLGARARTGKHISAAHTVTVCEKNIESIHEVIGWLIEKPENMKAINTVSFQTEAQVGRTQASENKVEPDRVWSEICKSTDQTLPRDSLLFGHPDCTSSVTLVARCKDRKIVNLSSKHPVIQRAWISLLDVFHAKGSPVTGSDWKRRSGLVLSCLRPRIVWNMIRALFKLSRSGLDFAMVTSLLRGKAGGFNIVMHNFMDEQEVRNPCSQTTRDRLSACSFRTAIKRNGIWEAVSMCEVNASIRADNYAELAKKNALVSDQSRSTVTLKPPLLSRAKSPSVTA